MTGEGKAIRRITGSVKAVVSAFLVRHRGVVTLIDTGAVGALDRILRAIKESGVATTGVGQIVLTHCHGDHTGEARKLKELTGATVVAGLGDVPVIVGTAPYPGPHDALSRLVYRSLPGFPRLTVDRPVGAREELEGGLVAIPTPGHTAGHLAVLAPDLSAVFVGDALWNLGSLRPSWRRFTWDHQQSIDSVRLLASLGADRVLFGHGPATSGRRVSALAARLR